MMRRVVGGTLSFRASEVTSRTFQIANNSTQSAKARGSIMRPAALAAFLVLASSAGAQSRGTVVAGTVFDSLAMAPAARVTAWQEDLDSATSVLLVRDRSFSAARRRAFERAMRTLRESVPRLRDDQVVVRLAQAVALSDNAHTRLYLLRNRTELRRYPFRIWSFSDGYYVVRTDSAHRSLLGTRILTMSGRPVGDVARRTATLYAGNDPWHRYLAGYTMTSPEVLRGLDLIASDTLELTIRSESGARRTVRVAPLPLVKSKEPVESWWDLAPEYPGRGASLVSALDVEASPRPLYLQRPQRNYWFEYVPSQRLLYLSYQRSQEQPDDSMTAFAERFFREVRERQPARLVIDLRFNTGGDLSRSEAFFKRIAELPLARRRGALFLVTGRATFSAGIFAAALLKQSTSALIVGESPGDRLDFWAEGGNYVLPNSGLTVHYADQFHSYSRTEYADRKPYVRDLSISSLDPDFTTPLSAHDYFAGRDPALDLIARRRR
jgi:hypothetical protein